VAIGTGGGGGGELGKKRGKLVEKVGGRRGGGGGVTQIQKARRDDCSVHTKTLLNSIVLYSM